MSSFTMAGFAKNNGYGICRTQYFKYEFMPDDLKSWVTAIPGLEGANDVTDGNQAVPEALDGIALPRVDSSPDLSDMDLSRPELAETGENTVVSAVRGQTQAVLAFGELELPEGQRPEDEPQIIPDLKKVVEEAIVKRFSGFEFLKAWNVEPEIDDYPKDVPLKKEFEEAIMERFNDCAETTHNGVSLDFEGYYVTVFHDRIQVSSVTELGPANVKYSNPEIKEIIEGLFRAESILNILKPIGYRLYTRGENGVDQYAVSLSKKTDFNSKEELLAVLDDLIGRLTGTRKGPEDEVGVNPNDANESQEVSLRKDFENAILKRFKMLADPDTVSVYLDFGRFDVRVLHDRIEVNSSTELGNAHAEDSYNQPEIKTIIEELFRAEALCNALIPKGYHIFRRGQTMDGYYEVILRRGIVFETKEDIVAYLDYLKDVLDVVHVQNTDSEIPPALKTKAPDPFDSGEGDMG